jgi:hypothetical protein
LNPIQAHYQAVLRPDEKRKMSPQQGIFKEENIEQAAKSVKKATPQTRVASDILKIAI